MNISSYKIPKTSTKMSQRKPLISLSPTGRNRLSDHVLAICISTIVGTCKNILAKNISIPPSVDGGCEFDFLQVIFFLY